MDQALLWFDGNLQMSCRIAVIFSRGNEFTWFLFMLPNSPANWQVIQWAFGIRRPSLVIVVGLIHLTNASQQLPQRLVSMPSPPGASRSSVHKHGVVNIQEESRWVCICSQVRCRCAQAAGQYTPSRGYLAVDSDMFKQSIDGWPAIHPPRPVRLIIR